MKPLTKNILIVAALAVVGAIIYGYKKVAEIQNIFPNITISPYGAKSVTVGLKEIKFKLDVILKNPTTTDFYLNGSVVATLTKLHIIYGGNVLGVANLQLTELSIPANGQTIIKDIPVTISTGNLINAVGNFQNLLKNLTIIGFIDVLGTEYQIGS